MNFKSKQIMIFLLLIIAACAGCSRNQKIEIINQIDHSYLPFDSLEYFPTFKYYAAKSQADLSKKLYLLSGRGRKPFAYELFISEEGNVEKVFVHQSAGKLADEKISELFKGYYGGTAKYSDRNVKYRTIIKNDFIFGKARDFNSEPGIEIISQDDNQYPITCESTVYNPGQKIDGFNFQYGKGAVVFRYNEKIISQILGEGIQTFFYKLFVNESGQIKKVKIMQGMGKVLDSLLISELPLSQIQVIDKSNKESKFSFTWNLQLTIQSDSIVMMTERVINNITIESNLDKLYANKIELINSTDNAYIKLEMLDTPGKDLMMSNYYPLTGLTASFDEKLIPKNFEDRRYEYVLFINELGLVDKLFIKRGFNKNVDNTVAEELRYAVFPIAKLAGQKAKYRGTYHLHFHKGLDKKSYAGFLFLFDERMQRNIYDLPSNYEEKDFIVLPEILPSPIGGMNKIAELVRYPVYAKKDNVEGRVLVKAFVDKGGNVAGVQVLQAIGYGCEQAAVDAIKQTKFTPGKNNNTPVKSILIIPVEFQLGDKIKISEAAHEEIKANEKIKIHENQKLTSNEFELDYFIQVECMPTIIGGVEALKQRIVYPDEAKKARIEGKVYMTIFIDEIGNVTHTELVKGIGGGCDEAAIDAIKKVKFEPGRHKGKAVKVQVTIPVLFKLK